MPDSFGAGVYDNTLNLVIPEITYSDNITITNITRSDSFEKQISIKSQHSISQGEKMFLDIPEEYILQGIPFSFDASIDGTKQNILLDESYDVKFTDTDQNGIADRIQWNASEHQLTLKADISDVVTIDASFRIQTMKEKIDFEFYDVMAEKLNKKSFIPATNLSTSSDIYDEKTHHRVIFLVDSVPANNFNSTEIEIQNKDILADELRINYDATEIYKGKHLGFVSALVPIQHMHSISDYDYVKKIGDGQQEWIPEYSTMSEPIGIVNWSNTVVNPEFNGTGVIVGVMDSGINQHHPDLPIGSDKVIAQMYCDQDQCRENPIPNELNSKPNDYKNHGTHIAGIIAGLGIVDPKMKGVAPGAKLLNMVPSTVGNGEEGFQDKRIRSFAYLLDWAMTNNADVINISLSLTSKEQYPVNCDTQYTTAELLIDEAIDEGLFIVKSAGNISTNSETQNDPYGTITHPGCAYNVITVGNMQTHGNTKYDDIRDLTSAVGPVFDDRMKPDLLAPGNLINSTDNCIVGTNNAYNNLNHWDSTRNFCLTAITGSISGTSYAAPFVSGAAAIILDAKDDFTPLEVKAALLAGAEWHGPFSGTGATRSDRDYTSANYENDANTNKLNKWGMGLLDIQNSVDMATSTNKIIKDSLGQGKEKQYTFTATQNEQVKIILTWFAHPNGGILNPENVPISNLDFTINNPSGYRIFDVDSDKQNVEFAVFSAPATGTYTIIVSAEFVSSTNIPGETFVLASSHGLTARTIENNSAPTLTVTRTQSVNERQEFSLNACNSTDADDDTLYYVWELPTNLEFKIIDNYTACNPSFQAPSITSNTNTLITVKAFDGLEYSNTRNVVVIVNTASNDAPTVTASSLSTLAFPEGNEVILQATGSDSNNDVLSYWWKSLSAPFESINQNSESFDNTFTFTAPYVSQNTTLIIQVTASDGELSSTSSVTLTIQNTNPITSLPKIPNPDTDRRDYFGTDIAFFSNDWMAIGSPNDDYDIDFIVSDSGSVSVFDAEGNLQSKIQNPHPDRKDYFGKSITAKGNSILIGTPGNDFQATDAGTVYIFNGKTGEYTGSIFNPEPESGDEFGTSIAISNTNKIAVGAPGDTTNSKSASGSVYIFDVNGNIITTITNPSPELNDKFGQSVVFVGDNILIGAPGNHTNGVYSSGAAYMYDVQGNSIMNFSNPNPQNSDDFGFDVTSINDSGFVISDRFANYNSTIYSSGAIYYYSDKDDSTPTHIQNPSPHSNDSFGYSVADGGDNYVLVGAPLDDTSDNNAGIAYLFDVVSGNMLLNMTNPDPDSNERFGLSTAATNQKLLIGTPKDDANYRDAGSVYLINYDFDDFIGISDSLTSSILPPRYTDTRYQISPHMPENPLSSGGSILNATFTMIPK